MSQTTSDLLVYRNQIINFVASMSIKMSAFADSLNTLVRNKGYTVDEDRPETWKYYVNLMGEYHPSDTVMTVMSLDTREPIDFTKENLSIHVRTAGAYVPGTDYFNKLCSRYPDQTDLAKSIVFPAPDIDLAIDSPDLTLLSYGSNIVEEYEEGYLVQCVNDFLTQVGYRWYAPYFSYEAYYTVTFFGQLIHRLVEMLFAARFKAIRTVNVHSWHVWQYLTSEGLENYSDVLNRQQYMFLYRNMDYLKANLGKQSNLIILANELLSTVGVGLYGRDVYQQTLTGADQCELTPELVAIRVPTDFASVAEIVPADTIEDANARMVAAGIEVNTGAEYIDSVTRTLGDTTLNTLPTKLLEIRPLPRDKKYADFFNLFVMDSLVYLAQEGKYDALIELYTTDSGESASLTVKDALVLLYYAIHKANRETPVYLPTKYTSYSAVRLQQNPIPQTIEYDGHSYDIRGLVNISEYASRLTYPLYTLITPLEFSDTVGTLFEDVLYQIISSRRALNTVQDKALRLVTQAVCVQETFALNLSTYTTYQEWFASRPDVVSQYTALYDSYSDSATEYSNLADMILTKLIPITATLEQYGNFQYTDTGYARLKQLFIQMCSYNITFLDTTRDVSQYMYTINASLYTKDIAYTSSYVYPDDKSLTSYPKITYAMDISGNDVEFTAYGGYANTLSFKTSVRMLSEFDKGNTLGAPNPLDVTPGPTQSTNVVWMTPKVKMIPIV